MLAAILIAPCPVNAVSAQCAIVIDGQTGRVLFEKNADKQTLIASVTICGIIDSYTWQGKTVYCH